ncbi:MAG: sensor histidine kinase [Pseudomonadota bacterium]
MVLRNLLDNAIKHHDKDHGHVRVQVKDTDDKLMTFKVIDDGPGIAAEHTETVFGMFRRLKSKDEIDGSGLGLSYVRKVIEQMGGEVCIVPRAERDRGCEVTFTWPKNTQGNVA